MNMLESVLKAPTAEDLMEMPDDGVERDIIRGELREREMTLRNRRHSVVEGNLVYFLKSWMETQPRPWGEVPCGEAGFRLRRDPETFVGIDLAYVSGDMVARSDPKTKFYDGPPVLAIEILSPSDQHDKVVEKVELYLEVGTTVWVVDPDFRTVSVHRAGRPVESYNDQQEIPGGYELPGFQVAVSRLFNG